MIHSPFAVFYNPVPFVAFLFYFHGTSNHQPRRLLSPRVVNKPQTLIETLKSRALTMAANSPGPAIRYRCVNRQRQYAMVKSNLFFILDVC
ncbi:hypothetical protein N658DRAFT_69917 [Parathielavia hyrcaniae]|uniref:Uncharacterized protein n=1 Tax=Parathielavia hyrcaniae TaxID=113614 RepID=A0AAN6T146_9PEZI|nr:hypothetical protein N658DRAFT_69917 [Parathielavia hyrcaniae]